VPSFRYRALTQAGEVVSGSITAPTAAEVTRRIEYLGLVPIEGVTEEGAPSPARAAFAFGRQPRPEDVTAFTLDLALLLRAGARIDDALDLLTSDIDIGRLQQTVAGIRASVLSGESFAAAIAHHPKLFPLIYVALVRVGEASGTLDHILELLADERTRAETLRRQLSDALRYPAFVLLAAGCVLLFFLLFVLRQFAAVLRDFGAKLDPVVSAFIGLSELLHEHSTLILATMAAALLVGWLLLRRPAVRLALLSAFARLPLVRSAFDYHRTTLFCRNLGVLLGSGVPLPATLRILVDIMSTVGRSDAWRKTAERVRQGGKLSDALADSAVLPGMAVRMLRLGEETGQLPMLAKRVAEFYESKLRRSLERVVGVIGPAAIVSISVIVGGLIVSVMTSLLSVSQIIG
jgi:general secretion pathway protein F